MDAAHLIKELDAKVLQCKEDAFAVNTRKTYSTHKKAYLSFCKLIQVSPFPASSKNIARYAVYLSKTKKYSTVKQYLNIIRLIHLENNLPNPLENDFNLTLVLRGLKRSLGCGVIRRLPITAFHLYHMAKKLDLNNIEHVVFWGAAILLFFTLLRRGCVLATKQDFDPQRHLCRGDITISPVGATVRVRHSKTIQFRDRELVFPLPRMKGNPLCPVRSIYAAIKCVKADPSSPVFMLSPQTYLSPEKFIQMTRHFLSDIVTDGSLLGAQSYRRGGASFFISKQCKF